MILAKNLLILNLFVTYSLINSANSRTECLDLSSTEAQKKGCNVWSLGFYAMMSFKGNPPAGSHTYSLLKILTKLLERCIDYQDYLQASKSPYLSKIVYLYPDDWDSTGIKMDDPQALLPSRLDQYYTPPNTYTNDTEKMKNSLQALFHLAENKLNNRTARAIYFFTDIGCDQQGYEPIALLLQTFLNFTEQIIDGGVPFRLFWIKQGSIDSCMPYLETFWDQHLNRSQDFIQWIDYDEDLDSYADRFGMCPSKVPALKPSSEDDSFQWWIVAVGVVGLMGLTIICVCIARRFCPKSICCFDRGLEMAPIEERRETKSNVYSHFHSLHNQRENGERPIDEWEIPLNSLQISTEKLGSGAYATVYVGILNDQPPVLKISPTIRLSSSLKASGNKVAIKTPHSYASITDKDEFMQEIKFMKALGYHPHLASLLGCQTDPYQPCIVTEICAKGDLLDLLRSQIRGDTDFLDQQDFIPMAWQVSDAMVYLASKNIIHRDIAARNVLVQQNKVVQLSDFGLCRFNEVFLYTTRGGRLPLKWMAPESLEFAHFSTKSDVWSYGVFLYELFSWGLTPYFNQLPDQMLPYLKAGNRLEIPDSPVTIKALMRACWDQSPANRPEFIDIRRRLYEILETAKNDYGYLEIENNTCQIVLD